MNQPKRTNPSDIPDYVVDYLDPRAEHVDRMMDKNEIGIYPYLTPPTTRKPKHGKKKPHKVRAKPE